MASSSSSAGPTLLGQLLSETFSYCKAHIVPLVAGVVVFGVTMGVVSASLAATAGGAVMKGMDDMGLDTKRMQQLADRMEQGDESAMDELEQMLAGEFDGMTDEQIAGRMGRPVAGMMATMAPAIGVSVVITWILSLLAFTYYTIVAVEGRDVNGTLSRMKSMFFSLFLVYLWAMLRSFVWIPFIGTILCIILGPRFVAAPLIHLMEGKGVMASVSDSYVRTRGYWGKIVGNMIVAVWLMGLIVYVANIGLITLLQTTSVAFMILISGIGSSMAIAFLAVFSVRLSRTILQQPRA